MQIVIIEGCDLAGKTYAIEKIGKYFNSGFVLKNTYKPKSLKDTNRIYQQYEHIMTCILDYLYASDEQYVFLDRFYPSQVVYSYMRKDDDARTNRYQAIERRCLFNKVKYIYLDTPLDVLKQRYDERGDEHITKEQIITIKERYDAFYEHTKLDKIKINTLNKNWIKDVKKFIEVKNEY